MGEQNATSISDNLRVCHRRICPLNNANVGMPTISVKAYIWIS